MVVNRILTEYQQSSAHICNGNAATVKIVKLGLPATLPTEKSFKRRNISTKKKTSRRYDSAKLDLLYRFCCIFHIPKTLSCTFVTPDTTVLALLSSTMSIWTMGIPMMPGYFHDLVSSSLGMMASSALTSCQASLASVHMHPIMNMTPPCFIQDTPNHHNLTELYSVYLVRL